MRFTGLELVIWLFVRSCAIRSITNAITNPMSEILLPFLGPYKKHSVKRITVETVFQAV